MAGKEKFGLRFLAMTVMAAAAFGLCGTSGGAEFPAKAITILCGSTAGSPVDIMARELAKQMEKNLRKAVVVQNRPGGSQAEELSTLLGQPADGHTLATVTTSTAGALAGHLRKQFKPQDFAFLALVQKDPYALVVRANSPYKDLKGLLEFAKANPGKVKIGGFGTGSGHHLAFLDVCDKAGVQMRWVSFDGGAAAIAAGLGGHVDVVHTNPGVVVGHVKGGKMRVLGVASEKRLDVLPQVATYLEQGIDLILFQWRGLAMKAGAPQAVVDRLIGSISEAVKTEEFKKYMVNTNQLASDLLGEQAQKYVVEDIDHTAERLKNLGIVK